MRYLKQFFIILSVTFAGELLRAVVPFNIPAGIYGMVLMLVLLCTGIIKLEQVADTAKFLVEIMPLTFVPAGVGLMDSAGVLQKILLPATVIIFATTVLVMVVTGRTAQFIIRKLKPRT